MNVYQLTEFSDNHVEGWFELEVIIGTYSTRGKANYARRKHLKGTKLNPEFMKRYAKYLKVITHKLL